MGELIAENWQFFVGLISACALIYYKVNSLSTKIDDQTRRFDGRFDGLEKDDEHDHKLQDHELRLTSLQKDVDHQNGWLREMREQLSEIYRRIVEKG